jgi:hypothetical protein
MADELDLVSSTLGATTARAAEALLRSLGDGAVILRLPLPMSLPNSDLGLATPLVEDVELAPAVLQVVRPDDDGTSRYEVAIAASAAEGEAAKRNFETTDDFFAAALGIVFGEKLLRIVNATPHACGATVYLYRLQARG